MLQVIFESVKCLAGQKTDIYNLLFLFSAKIFQSHGTAFLKLAYFVVLVKLTLNYLKSCYNCSIRTVARISYGEKGGGGAQKCTLPHNEVSSPMEFFLKFRLCETAFQTFLRQFNIKQGSQK